MSDHPMRPVEFLVLAVLHDRPLHGYGIVQEIAHRTDGEVDIAPGNLYRVLDRLLERGLLAQADRPGSNDDRRRYYRITRGGRETLTAEARILGGIAGEVLRDRPEKTPEAAG